MKNRISVLGLIVVSFFLITGCHKDPGYVPPVTVTGSSDIDTLTVVISQEKDPFIRLLHKKEIKAPGSGGVMTMPLDVDGDGTTDFEFKINTGHQLSGGGWSMASITGVHGTFEFNTYNTIDTTFRSDSIQIRDGSYWDKKIAVVDTRTYTCRRLKDSDKVETIQTTGRISHFSVGENNDPSPDWSREEIYFHKLSTHSSFLYEENRNSDTVWFFNYARDIVDCQQFPIDTTCIRIQYTIDGVAKPGWIKLIASPGYISVLESQIIK